MGEATRRVAKPRSKSAAAKKVTSNKPAPQAGDPWQELLSPGDRIEFTATVEVRDSQGRSYWPKAGVTTQVRAGETVTEASERASKFVHWFLEDQAKSFTR